MSITLGDLRLFATEAAAFDISDSKANRQIIRWINQALQRIYREHGWNHWQRYARITLDPPETGVALAANQGSGTITLGGAEVFDSKYVTQEWALQVTSETNFHFSIASIDDAPTNQTATLGTGQKWIRANATGLAYSWARYVYSLPNDARRVMSVEDLASQLELCPLEPREFDRQRNSYPLQQEDLPRYFTIRAHKIEFWPFPAAYRVVGLSYEAAPTLYTTASLDATTVDWVDGWEDLLQKAVMLEASVQGDCATVPFPVAMAEYVDCLNDYKAKDSELAYRDGEFKLRSPSSSAAGRVGYRNWGTLGDP